MTRTDKWQDELWVKVPGYTKTKGGLNAFTC